MTAPPRPPAGQAKYDFIRAATLNGFIGLGHQTARIGGEYIVACAEAAWDALEKIRSRANEGG